MNKIDFWSEWETPYRLVFKILAVLLLALMAVLLVVQFGDISIFYDWQITAYLQEVLYPVHSNHSEFLESTVNTEISLILQKVTGGYQLLPLWMVFLLLGVIYTSIVSIWTMATYLSRFWFIVSAGLFIVLMAGSGIGKLGVAGLQDEMAIGLIAGLFIIPAYYFNALNKEISLPLRFLVFIGLMLFCVLLITFTSKFEAPLLHLAYYAYWPAFIMSVVFIFIIGHEIVYAILVLTTQGVTQEGHGNAIHFVVFSVVYLLNLALVYFRSTGYIDWDIYYVNPFLLLCISGILGIWGLKGREVLYGNSLPFYPYTILLYLSMGIGTLTSILFFSLSGNDSTLEAIEDAVVFGHIAFGGMFFLYIIINFINLLMKNLPIYKIAFKDDNFPYATARLAGLIVVAAFFFVSNYAPLSQAVSGYFNGIGDMNLNLGRVEAARSYYGYGATYGNMLAQSNGNHRSNYMLGALESDPEKIIPKMKEAVRRRPSEYAYASLGAAYEDDNRFFEALFTYQKGLKQFPNSWAIRNNLALLYNRTNVTDSVLFYLDGAEDDSWHGTLTAANLLAIATMKNIPIDFNILNESDRLGFQNNQLGYKISKGKLSEAVDPSYLESLKLHLYSYSYLKNLGLACANNGDKTYLQIVDHFIAEPRNGDYLVSLKFIKGLNLYKQGNISSAFELMKIIESDGKDNGMVNALLGKWSMELGSPFQASKYFEKSRESGYPWATSDLAQMYSLLGDNSLGQYLLNNEALKLDSSRVDAKRRLVELEKAIEQGKISWSDAYAFNNEQEDFINLQALAKGENKDNIAVDFEQLGLQNPFYEEGVIASVAYFNAIKRDQNTAYNILLNAIATNEYSEGLIKAYIDQCFQMGLVSYAEGSILRLYDIMNLEDFQAYELMFEEKKTQASANLAEWE